MFSKTITQKLVIAVSALGLVMAMPVWAAQPTPAFTLSDGTNSVTVSASGAPVFSSPCNGCSTGTSSGMGSHLKWTGTLGIFSLAVDAKTEPNMDLAVTASTIGNAAGTLTASFSDTGFTKLGPVSINGSTNLSDGSVGFTYSSYVSNSNTLFATSIPSASTGPTTLNDHPGFAASFAAGSGQATVTPFSATLVETIALTAGSDGFSNDVQLTGTVPPPLTLTCSASSGFSSPATYSSSLVADGGFLPAYTFAIVGNLPPGLTLNPATGLISGTPTTPGTYTFTAQVTDGKGTTVSTQATGGCTITITPPSNSCVLPYPTGSAPALSSVVFNESTVLQAFMGPSTPGGQIKAWYSDEHAPVLGVRAVSVTSGGTTTTTPYPVAAYNPASPSAINPAVGATALTGDQAGTDTALDNSSYNFGAGYATNGRPLYPSIFLTDLTANGPSSMAGDWQQGGTSAVPPSAVYGVWKSAIRSVDKSTSPATITVTTDADPTANNFSGIPDVPPGGWAAYTTEQYNTEAVWNVSSLSLIPGHVYRAQIIVHDGDQNKAGGDVGEACVSGIVAPAALMLSCVANTGTVGVPYNSSLVATGGVAPYTYSITGTLPPGLTFTNGVLSGTPTGPGIFTVTGKVVDSSGNTVAGTVTTQCTITIMPPPTLSLMCPPTTSYVGGTSTLVPNGGYPAYTFSYIGTGLGNGSFNATTGTFTWGSTTVSPFNFTATVTDSTGAMATTGGGGCTVSLTAPPPPGISLTKTANPASAAPFQLVTFTYTVKNTGGTTLNNIIVTDDNGTPGYTADDFTVGTVASLAPGGSQMFTWQTYPPLNTVIVDSKLGTIPGGNLIIQNVNSPAPGIKFTLNQALTLNDNSYGTNSSAGWTAAGKTHKFQDLTGSDQAEWQFYDSKGTLVLDFNQDYISAASAPAASCPNASWTSYPSGYGTLGWCGGDGKFGTGTSSYILSENSTLTDDLNTPPFTSGYTTNSPATGTPGWNFVDGYSVIISNTAFGANGFGSVSIPLIHNSPSMNATDQIAPTPTSSVSTNTATATASSTGPVTSVSASATASVTITATTSGGGGGGKTTPLKVTFPGGTNGTVGTAFTATVTATGGTGAYHFSSGALPAGLSLNATTGVISGTPAAATSGPTAAVTITVTDSASPAASGTATGNININPPAKLQVQFPSGPAANGTVGTPYTGSFTVTGGIGPYSYSISPALPSTLTLNPSTGSITGTPTAVLSGPSAQFTVSVTDSESPAVTATQNGNINIAAPPQINVQFPGGPTATGKVGTPFNASITATGGAGTLTFSITAGSLAHGLSMSSSGVISGTPTAPATGPAAQITITVTDTYGDSKSQNGNITVNP